MECLALHIFPQNGNAFMSLNVTHQQSLAMNSPLPPAMSHSLLPVSRILRYVLQPSYDLFGHKGNNNF